MDSRHILITGGCGFIGTNLLDFCIGKGLRRLSILDNLAMGKARYLESVLSSHGRFTKESLPGQKIRCILNLEREQAGKSRRSHPPEGMGRVEIDLTIGDIRDRDTCLMATEGVDTVVHLAAHAGVIPSVENPYYDFEVNALGTLNLLHASVVNHVERFIFASSNAPLGEQHPPMNENQVPRPLSPYGASKLAGEAYCSAFCSSYGLKTVCLRFSNAYGPHSLHKRSVIAKFIKDGLLKGGLIVYGDGSQTRDFVHVSDLCRAISQSMEDGIWGETIHLGTGQETSVLTLAHHIKELFGNGIQIRFEPSRRGEIQRNYSDIRKAKTILGFEHQVSIQEGVEQVYRWFMAQPRQEIIETSPSSGSD